MPGYEDIEKLAELKEKGYISEDEFLKKKKEILNSSGKNENFEKESYQTDKSGKKEKSHGLAGFILALISLFLPIPGFDIMIGVLAFVLSAISMSKNQERRGLAIAGFVISIFAVVGSILFWTFFEEYIDIFLSI